MRHFPLICGAKGLAVEGQFTAFEIVFNLANDPIPQISANLGSGFKSSDIGCVGVG